LGVDLDLAHNSFGTNMVQMIGGSQWVSFDNSKILFVASHQYLKFVLLDPLSAAIAASQGKVP
jgi:hypothetical protein